MPLDQLPVPDITLQDSDKATTFKTKINALAAALKTAMQAFNTQIAAGNVAENSAVVAGEHKDAAAASATTAGEHKNAAATSAVTAGQHKDSAAALVVTAGQHKDTAAASATAAGGNKDAAIAANVLAQQAAAIAVQYTDGQYAAHRALIESVKRKFTTVLDFDEESYGIYDTTTLSFTKKALADIGGFTRESDAIARHPTRLVTYGANIPRIEYDAVTGERLGYLGEEQRHNLLSNSQYTGANGETPAIGWALGQTSGVTTTAASPRVAGAIRVTNSGATLRDFYSQTVTLLPNTTYTLSAFFASGTLAGGALMLAQSAGGDSPTGTTSLTSASALNDVRSSITFTTGTIGGSYSIRIGLGCNTGTTGTVIHETPMLEASSFVGSYIPTTDNPLTRIADRFNISRPQVSARKGTIFVCFMESSKTTASGVAVAVAKFNNSPNTSQRGFGIYRDGANSLRCAIRDASGLLSISIGAVDFTKFIKAVVSFDYDSGTFSMCINGGPVSSSSIGSIDVASFVSNLIIGGRVSVGGNVIDGLLTFRKVWEGPVSLIDAEMQAITRF